MKNTKVKTSLSLEVKLFLFQKQFIRNLCTLDSVGQIEDLELYCMYKDLKLDGISKKKISR